MSATESMDSVFIDVEIAEPAASDVDLAKKLEEVCPVNIFKATGSGTEIVGRTARRVRALRALRRGRSGRRGHDRQEVRVAAPGGSGRQRPRHRMPTAVRESGRPLGRSSVPDGVAHARRNSLVEAVWRRTPPAEMIGLP